MEVLVQITIIYLTVGAAIALLLALGVAQTQMNIVILDRDVDERYAQAALLVMSILFWWIVVFMIVQGKRQAAAQARAERDQQEDDARVQRFAGQG